MSIKDCAFMSLKKSRGMVVTERIEIVQNCHISASDEIREVSTQGWPCELIRAFKHL